MVREGFVEGDDPIEIFANDYAEKKTRIYSDFRLMGLQNEDDVIFYDNDFCFFYNQGVNALWKMFAGKVGKYTGMNSPEVITAPDGYASRVRLDEDGKIIDEDDKAS